MSDNVLWPMHPMSPLESLHSGCSVLTYVDQEQQVSRRIVMNGEGLDDAPNGRSGDV